MSDTYFDLPSRLEDSFPEIDSDIVTDLRKTSEEYAEIQQQISDLKKRFPCIMKVMEDKGEIHLTAEEHAAFVHGYPESWMIWSACSFTSADIRMRWLTSKKSKRSDFNGSEQSGPFYMIDTYRQTTTTCYKLLDNKSL